MNRTILSLAIIKANWDRNKTDYIDNFIPLMAGLLKEKDYREVDLNNFQEDFKERYGLIIPIHALVTIFTRAKKNNIIYQEYGKIYARKENLSDYDHLISSTEIERKFRYLIQQIKDFAYCSHKLEIDINEIEIALLAFLKEHDLDILFAAKDRSLLPEVKPNNKKLKFIISAFSIHAFESEPLLFQFLLDVSVGHALSAAILYSELNSFTGKLKNLNIYLDTSIILDLLGFNGEYKKKSIKELIDILIEQQANIFILDITRGEVDSILTDCYKWLEKGSYSLEKASRVLKYCLRNGLTSSDITQVLVSLDRLISENGIAPAQIPSYSETKFVIDEADLEETIYKTYESIIDNFDREFVKRKGTIKRDVDVLSGIYRFRKGYKPTSIKNSKALFVTSNTALAFASKRFETNNNGGTSSTIPSCLTDVFLGTVIWLQSPQRVEAINSKRFMADCYAAIQPNDALIKKFFAEVEKLKVGNKISNDDYYLLRSHHFSLSCLESESMGDPDAIDASSTAEILDRITQSIRAEDAKKLGEEAKAHQETKNKLLMLEEEARQAELALVSRAEKISISIGILLFILSNTILAFCIFANFYPEHFTKYFAEYLNISDWLKDVLWALLAITTLISLEAGFNLKGWRSKVVKSINVYVLNFLKRLSK